jgi:hypothetical protein
MIGVAVDPNLYLEAIYAQVGLYHPDTLFKAAYSPLLRQAAYIQRDSLDLAWARGDTINTPALLISLALVILSAMALLIAWRRKLRPAALAALPILMTLIALRVLVLYAPTGDMAELSQDLSEMEETGEVVALTNLVHTEAFQDSYDGRLWVWGVPSRDELETDYHSVWTVGQGDPGSAAARFQYGTVRADYLATPEQRFDVTRLPGQAVPTEVTLDKTIRLAAVRLGPPGNQVENPVAHPGELLPLSLYWQALDQIDSAYTVFVQAVGTDGSKAAQVDKTPCEGACPTDSWKSGNLVGERYDLVVSDETSPGSYEIIVGMYNLETGQNLSWFDAQDNLLGPNLTIGHLEVLPERE